MLGKRILGNKSKYFNIYLFGLKHMNGSRSYLQRVAIGLTAVVTVAGMQLVVVQQGLALPIGLGAQQAIIAGLVLLAARRLTAAELGGRRLQGGAAAAAAINELLLGSVQLVHLIVQLVIFLLARQLVIIQLQRGVQLRTRIRSDSRWSQMRRLRLLMWMRMQMRLTIIDHLRMLMLWKGALLLLHLHLHHLLNDGRH